MKASSFRFSITVLLFVFLGLFASTSQVHAEKNTQQIVLESDHDAPVPGMTAEQVEQLEDTEKFTFQVRKKNKRSF